MKDASPKPAIVLVRRQSDDELPKPFGAWKLAYADFVTAMMAFFLLMWLLSSPRPSDLAGLADYFTLSKPTATQAKGQSASQSDSKKDTQGGKAREQDKKEAAKEVKPQSSMLEMARQELKIQQEKADQQRLENLKDQLQAMIDKDPNTRPYRDQIKLDNSVEGLLIQLIDGGKRPMFDSGSANLRPYAADILGRLTQVLNQVDNRMTVTGHTDGIAFSARGGTYSNWELSSDRANSSRRAMVSSGLLEQKVIRVVGMADANPMVEDPADPVNRRIEILVLTKKAEVDLLKRRILEGL
ncbi:MAG TPA: flagellar motor protein MotB [Limnobacter sp.]|uniref:flagellar motor protein MotB n=1 Tax=Limnobacter sp. TaxID=2003368 RepID=UPI002ED8CCD9